MTPHLGRNSTEICLIIIYVLDYIYNRFNHFLFFEPRYFTAEKPGIILQLNSSEGSPTAELFWIYVGTVFRPKINQNIVYNDYKRVHGTKCQSFALMNVLVILVVHVRENGIMVPC